jgi:hypothetical protein
VDVVPNSYKIVLKRFKSTKVELTGPVGGAVVSAEDGQNGQVPNRDLRYQRHYISERFDGILAYQSRGMRSQRIEVSQRNNVPLFIGVCDVFEHLLDEIFGLSVNVRDVVAHAVRLCDREEIGLAVDRARAGEDQLEAPELFHYLEEVQHSDQVVLVVKQRVLHGLADGFDRGEVDHAVDFVLGEDVLEGSLVQQVALIERDGLAGDGLDAFQRDGLTVRAVDAVDEVVDDDDFVTGAQKLDDAVAADVAGASRHEHGRQV